MTHSASNFLQMKKELRLSMSDQIGIEKLATRAKYSTYIRRRTNQDNSCPNLRRSSLQPKLKNI